MPNEAEVPLTQGEPHAETRPKGFATSMAQQLRRIGEGPRTLRFFCFLGGLGVVLVTAFRVLNILKLVWDPAAYLLNFCIVFLGLLVMLIELKDCNGGCSRSFEEWAKFLTVPLGKGLLYGFIGLLNMSQGFILVSPSFIVGKARAQREIAAFPFRGLHAVHGRALRRVSRALGGGSRSAPDRLILPWLRKKVGKHVVMHLRERLAAREQPRDDPENTSQQGQPPPGNNRRLIVFALAFAALLASVYKLHFTPLARTMFKNDRSTDNWHVYVIGGGLAGCAAANEALRLGAQVTLVDKVKLGGNSAKATSGINAAGTKHQAALGIDDSPALFRDDILASGQGSSDPALAESLAARSADALAALEAVYGKSLQDVAILGGHSIARTHRLPSAGKPQPLGYTVMSAFRDFFQNAGDNFRLLEGSRLTDLRVYTHPSGISRVTGVTLVDAEGKEVHSNPDAVVLATGGFAADLSGPLLQKFCPQCKYTTNGPFATGDVQILAESLGLAVTDLEKIQLHPTGFVDPANPTARTKFLCPEVVRGSGAVLLDTAGSRFVNELLRRDQVTEALFERGGSLRDWRLAEDEKKDGMALLVMDNHVRQQVGEPNFDFYRARGLIATYDNLAGLAAAYDWPEETVRETFARFAASAAAGRDDFGREVFPTDFSSFLTGTSPIFTAIVTPAVHYTMGGLKVNSQLQTAMTDGSSVVNLFAAGEVMGGLHGKNRLGGTGMTEGATFGKLAGRNAARLGNLSREPFGPSNPRLKVSVDTVNLLSATGVFRIAFESLFQRSTMERGSVVALQVQEDRQQDRQQDREIEAEVVSANQMGFLELQLAKSECASEFAKALTPGQEGFITFIHGVSVPSTQHPEDEL